MLLFSIAFTTTAYSLACLFVGNFILNWTGGQDVRKESASLASMANAFIMGLGILGSAWLLIAIFSGFYPIIIFLVIIPLSIGGGTIVYRKMDEIQSWIKYQADEFRSFSWDLRTTIGLTVLFGFSGFTFLGQSVYGDGAGFYLALAKIISSTHKLAILPGYESLMSVGLSGEMHFAAFLSLGSPGAIQLIPWLTTIGSGILLARIARSAGIGRYGQWLILAMVLSSSAIVEIGGNGKTDLFALAYGVSAFYLSFVKEKANGPSLLIIGLLAGFSIIAKFSYAISFLPSLGILLIWAYINRARRGKLALLRPGEILSSNGWFILGLVLAISPHLIKNQVLLGNFLLPFDGSDSGWQLQSWHGPDTTRRIMLSLPFSLTFGNYWAQFGNLSPLVLAFMPLCLIVPRQRQIMKKQILILSLAGIAGVLAWFILRPTVFAPRYILASLVLFTIPPVWAADHFLTSNKPISNTIRSMIVLAVIVTLTSSWFYFLDRNFHPGQTYRYLIGRIGECEKEPRYCSLITRINENAPPGSRLFSYALVRYWLRPDLIQCALTTHEKQAYLDLKTSEQRWSFIYGRGFQWVPIFYTGNRLETLVLKDLNHIPEWLTISQTEDESNLLLKLASKDHSRKPGVACGMVAPASWSPFDLSEFLLAQ